MQGVSQVVRHGTIRQLSVGPHIGKQRPNHVESDRSRSLTFITRTRAIPSETISKLENFLHERLTRSQVSPLSDGFCNEVFQVRIGEQKRVVKMYSTVSKMRTRPEFRGLGDLKCAEMKLSPAVTCHTYDGIAHEHIEGRVLAESDVHTAHSDFLDRLARKVHRLHSARVPSQYGDLFTFLNEIKMFSAPTGDSALLWSWFQAMLRHLRSRKITSTGNVMIEEIESEISYMKNYLLTADLPIVFCHGDLKPSNLLIEDCGEIWMIDLELAGPNYRGFDLMKLFRSEPNNFSKENFLCFLTIYAAYGSRTSVEELTRECRICEALTWLEAAIFFATLLSISDVEMERNIILFEDRWKSYLFCKEQYL